MLYKSEQNPAILIALLQTEQRELNGWLQVTFSANKSGLLHYFLDLLDLLLARVGLKWEEALRSCAPMIAKPTSHPRMAKMQNYGWKNKMHPDAQNSAQQGEKVYY